jgi:hypothetical protein
MQAIPAFQSRPYYPYQLLPDGVYRADEATFRVRFVEGFPTSTTRRSICDGLFLLRRDAAEVGIAATQWIDGSFVENKLHSNDIDLVSFCDYERLNAMGEAGAEFVDRYLVGGPATRIKYACHGFLVPSCSPSHPYYPLFESQRSY